VSIQKRSNSYVVRWREGGRQLSRSFTRRGDAVAFETDVKRRQQLGALAPGVIQSRMTLAEFVREEWWPRYAVPNLKPSTQRRYLEVWGTHLLPALGDYELRAITPMLVEDLRADFDAHQVGVQTQRKALPQGADDPRLRVEDRAGPHDQAAAAARSGPRALGLLFAPVGGAL
jgi:hypothetical protein